jgi:hypothetical protein
VQFANLASQKGGPLGGSGGFDFVCVFPQQPVPFAAGIALGKLESLVEIQSITPASKALTQPFSGSRRQVVAGFQEIGKVG